MSISKKSKATEPAAEALKPAFLGNRDGVSASEVEGGGYAVAFEFDRQLARMLRDVPGAVFNKAEAAHHVPAASLEALDKAVSAMRTELKAVQGDLKGIMDLATASGVKAQRDNGAAHGVEPQVSEFHIPGKFYGGEIVNANSRFVAQFSGFGKIDGAAFLTIHRLADLDRGRIMKGEHVGITYDARFVGAVVDLMKEKSDAELEADYKHELGKPVDGVTLTDRGDKLGVAFDVNPALIARIRRVEGAAFNTADKVWEVPQDKREFALRTVQAMRHEFVLDGKEVEMMHGLAEGKMDGAKVFKAYTKDGQEHFGKVLAVGDRYALQKAGQDKFTLHHLAALDQTPRIDQNLAIKYNKGVGVTVDQELKRAQDKALGVSR